MPVMSQKLRLESTLVASEHQVHRVLDDEAVILDLQKSAYFGTEGVGRLVWEKMQSPITVSAMLDEIVEQYEVSMETAQDDLLVFLQHLLDQSLIKFAP